MFSVPCLFQAVFEFVAQSLSHAPSPPPSALGPWDWDPANSVLLCQLLPVRLCQDRALGGDCKAGGRGETRSSRSATYPPDSEKGGLWARTAEGHLSLSFCHSVVSDFLRPRGLQDARLPVPHHILECAQTPVHWVNDAIQPSLPRPPPSPATLWGSTSIREQVPGPGCLRSAWPGRHSPPAATGLTMCPGPEASCFCLKLSLAIDNGSPSPIGGDQGGPFLLALSRDTSSQPRELMHYQQQSL